MIGGIQVASATFDQTANALRDVKVIFSTHPSTPSDDNPGFGARSGGRQDYGSSRIQELFFMMFPDAKNIQSCFICESDPFQ